MPPERLYHLSRDGQSLGKHTERELRELLRVGKLKPTDDYWTLGMKAWAKLAILPPARPINSSPQPTRPSTRPVATPVTASKPTKRWLKYWPVPTVIVGILAICVWAATSMPTRRQQDSRSSEPEPYRAAIELTRNFAPFHPMGKEIFPSQIIAFASSKLKPTETIKGESPHYGHPDFMAGAVVSGPRQGDKLSIEVTADRFIRRASFSLTVPVSSHYATIGPATSFDFEALLKVRQSTPFNVTIKVRRNDEEPVVFTEVWQAHQLNDWPNRFSLLRLNEADGVVSTSHHGGRILAGYVNENHPMIDQVLAEAKATRICPAFTGYGDDKEEVLKQIEAIWAALRKRSITYSNTAESTRSPLHSFQHVRFFDQSLQSGQANCVDATTMLASILKKIGLNVGVIFVPNHAYLVVYDKTGKKREFAIESTGIASMSLPHAIRSATEEEPESLRKVEDRLNSGSGDYHEVAIEDCRRAGIQPIPYSP
jgi:hypothetical protein